MEGYSIYVLRSEVDQRLYVGMSKNIKEELMTIFMVEFFQQKDIVPGNLSIQSLLACELKLVSVRNF